MEAAPPTGITLAMQNKKWICFEKQSNLDFTTAVIHISIFDASALKQQYKLPNPDEHWPDRLPLQMYFHTVKNNEWWII